MTRTEWRIPGAKWSEGLNLGPDVRTELHVVVDSDDPDVLAAIERAAAGAGVELERVDVVDE